jgi:predicted nucleic acid-binding protein
MILLATDVLSAVMQADPPKVVIAWLDRQPARSVWITAVTVFEVEYGLQRMPASLRRSQLEEAFRATIAEELGGRILALDAQAALSAGAIAAAWASAGRTPDFRDALIAGIARARGAVLATRNMKHFEGVCQLVDPWANA